MKKFVLVLLVAASACGLGFGLEAGGGISVFVPESLYLHGQGSISVETNFQWSIGLSKMLSIPIGVSYNKIYGMTVSGLPTGLPDPTDPWFFADSIMPYIMAKIHLPLWIFYLDVFGGGALNWNATLTPIGQNIESYLAAQAGSGTDVSYTIGPTNFRSGFDALGWGWLAGAGIGVSVQKVRVDITGTYRDVTSPLALSGSYYTITRPASGTTSTTAQLVQLGWPDSNLIMRGFSVGLNGTFSF